MDEKVLKQVAEAIAAKRVNISLEEARDLAKRALKFKQEHNRLPDITSSIYREPADYRLIVIGSLG